jgi:lantibiotic modifying enzyme
MIVQGAKPAGAGVEWGDTTDIISGSAGTGLFLLYAAREFQQPALMQLAARAGTRLIELARKEGAGLKWAMDPKFPRLMPNFSHGTAGIAYFLTALYGETRDRRFLDAAVAGARYLQSVAKTEGDVCLVFHNEPDGKDLYYLGWCHGPVGTARLFFRLYQVTKDREWLTWVQKSAQALRASGIPETRTPGFWNNVGQCCGSAGVADFFLALWRETADARDLAFARRMTDDMLARATPAAGGLKWIQAEHRAQPNLLIAQTGYMQGAAGIGSALLHFATALDKRPVGIRFPDSPY